MVIYGETKASLADSTLTRIASHCGFWCCDSVSEATNAWTSLLLVVDHEI